MGVVGSQLRPKETNVVSAETETSLPAPPSCSNEQLENKPTVILNNG